jgi:hypothetical protein
MSSRVHPQRNPGYGGNVGPAEEVWGGGRVGVGHRLAALGGFPSAALPAALVLAIAGCNGDGGSADDGAVGSTTSSATASVDVDGATADLRELLGATPEAIATDVSALALTSVTADQVADVAATLCGAAFDPEVTTSWLQSLIVTNVAMMGPANRLLRYAGTPAVCPRAPTAAERDFYAAEVYRVLEVGPALPPGATEVPARVQATVCELLDTRGSEDPVGTALQRLLEMAARGPFDPAEFLPYVVQAAGAGCDRSLPTAVQAMERYLGT